jgi:hypothetical protein
MRKLTFKFRNYFVGLSNGALVDGKVVGEVANSYGIADCSKYGLFAGDRHYFKFPDGSPLPKWEGDNVVGCGLLRNAKKECEIFFTLNGELFGSQTAIAPSAECLFPTVSLYPHATMCANFGGEKKWKWGLHKFPKLSYDIFFH